VYLLLGYFCFNSPGVTGYSGIHSWKVKLNNDNSSSSSNWRPSTQMESGCSATNNSEMEVDPYWRSAFPVVSREKIISKLMSTLLKHSPINAKGMGGQNLKSIALRFEDKIYSTATSKVQDICVVHICYYFLQTNFHD
jgi:hypothetical protein